MLKFSRLIVKYKIPILILSLILLVPSVIGIINTRINYDMLTYLPSSMDTVKGQNIMLDEFGKGAFSLVIVEGMQPKDISKLADKVREINHVDTVVWYDSLLDVSVPMDVLPDEVYDAFNKGDSTLFAVFFDTSTSEDNTINAIEELRAVVGKNCYVSGMSALVTDLRDLCEEEEPTYVALAVLCAVAVMMLFMDSFIVPFLFLASIGIAVVINLGSNVFLGEISYITKALSAVLQLAVTMDYSIFLWHSYEEQQKYYCDKNEAMSHAITETITSIVGSSITTIAGFIALCFMSFTLGKDLGIVMAKGVVLGVIGCVTTLPSLILIFDKLLEKTKHKAILPQMDKVAKFIVKAAPAFLVLLILLAGPAIYGYSNTEVYYELSQSLPKDMEFAIANSKLKDDFDMASTHMILIDSSISQKDIAKMTDEINEVDGVKSTLGLSSVVGSAVPEEILPDSLVKVLKSDKYNLLLVSSEYKVASDEVNNQVSAINAIIKSYDKKGMLIGEAPCTKDLIDVTDKDFVVVTWLSIMAIFIIIAIIFKSISLPIILVCIIEFAIFINLGIPFYTHTALPFIAPICISTIQLGATVDYAILLTTRYRKERRGGNDKKSAMITSLSVSIPSIIVSALGFFAATFGVALYSDIDMISSMCFLISKGALISMCSVILILPSVIMLCDKIICKTSYGFIGKNNNTEVAINE